MTISYSQAPNKMLLRDLPSVDRLLQMDGVQGLLATYGRDLTVTGLRHCVEEVRVAVLNGRIHQLPSPDALIAEAGDWLADLLAPTLQPVINATGVIVHTNLGRAPLSEKAIVAIQETAVGYATLEYDLTTGSRGSRSVHAEQLLRRITQAEAALVVNNNAAAVLLMLTALCRGREVIISRGQLVEIGGGFRIPDVMAQSGAKLVEVGTTNRTHLRDYVAAITENTAAILVAHHSNYKIIGFTSEPSLAELAELAHAHNLPLLYDQGSGALLDSAPYGLTPEPTVLDGLAAGCDLVAFSGDKLLGGPQAGILVGRGSLVAVCKQHPLARAVRADKLCLAGLAATLGHYLVGEAVTAVPVWRMIARSVTEIEVEAVAWTAVLQQAGIAADVVVGESTVGGGSLPGSTLPTFLVRLLDQPVEQLTAVLRRQPVPVIGRIQDDALVLDPRTVLPHQVELLCPTLVHCVGQLQAKSLKKVTA
jgi:L-seryl-tRNA(Ser) seleniumtransferase